MAILKCKMCGGDLNAADSATVVECEYCGTNQTIPTSRDEEVMALFERAELLRRKCDFDRAEETYEKILEIAPKEAEAYWGVILCKFGVEYVEDPQTKKRIPTCHRTSYDAIVTDEYFKEALKNADVVQRTVYENEAKAIDKIQRGILDISKREAPFDVFISYKETDEYGKRTKDSAIANEIYYQLLDAGYKVFYSAITLEDKLGEAYEPYIFSALNSAKVMLVVGTKPEYFNAVWVKNEWSRFLKMMKKDRTKQLIPCYREMDPYDLPEEFAHIQAQDMSKIGFINDVVRGIKKIIVKEEPKPQPQKPQSTGYTYGKRIDVEEQRRQIDVPATIQKAWNCLELGEFSGAQNMANRVISVDPVHADAYVIKFLAFNRLKSIDEYKNTNVRLAYGTDYQKAVQFGATELKDIRKEKEYDYASSLCFDAKTIEDYRRARAFLVPLGDYKNCLSLIEMCDDKIKAIETLKIKERTEEILYSEKLAPMAEAACKMVEKSKEIEKLELENKKERKKDCIIAVAVAVLAIFFLILMIANDATVPITLCFIGFTIAAIVLYIKYLLHYNKQMLVLNVILLAVTAGFALTAVPVILGIELKKMLKINKQVQEAKTAYVRLKREFEHKSSSESEYVRKQLQALASQGYSPLKIADMIAEKEIEY